MKHTFLSILLLLTPIFALAQPKVVAHRGHWKPEGSAQNSIRSLQLAAEVGCYGSEFDVWVTSDGVPVVFHDDKMDGLRIDATTFAELMNHQLKNGEFLPTLQQYLTEGMKHPECQLILELKPHRTPQRDTVLVDRVLQLVHLLGIEKQVEYISFSRTACAYLHSREPQAPIAYLSGDLKPSEVKALGWTGIDYNEGVFASHPDWLQEAKREGIEVNVWTVDGEKGLLHHMSLPEVDIITTNDPDLLIKLKQSKK